MYSPAATTFGLIHSHVDAKCTGITAKGEDWSWGLVFLVPCTLQILDFLIRSTAPLWCQSQLYEKRSILFE